MLPLTLSLLLAAAPASPPPPVTLRAGAAEPGAEVSLNLVGLSVPAEARAGLYLLGNLSVPSHSLRALLLRSTDGGARWTEVLPEVEGSQVLFLHFTGCQGRALVGWTTEGPGELTLFGSTDCGATWKRRSTLPKAVWSEWPEYWLWSDAERGTVWVRDANEEDPPLRALATRDGGRTWSPLEPPPPPPSTPVQEQEVQTASGTRWRLVHDERSARVERQEPNASPTVRASFPLSWRRERNRLVPTP